MRKSELTDLTFDVVEYSSVPQTRLVVTAIRGREGVESIDDSRELKIGHFTNQMG